MLSSRVVSLLVAVVWTGVAAAPYHVLKRIPISGDYGWDYLTADSAARRLYVSHDREVVVLDLDTDRILGTIPGSDVHGIAIAKSLGRGFISASDPGSVTIFDLNTLAVLDKLRVGDDPNGIIFDEKTGRVFTADRGSKRLTAIDARTGKIVGSVEGLGGRTEHLAADGAGHVYLNMQDRNTVLRIDARAMNILDTWPLAPCEQPSSMDMDRRHARIFIGCRSGVMAVVDARNGRIVTMQPIGRGVDATEFDPGRELVFFSTGGDQGTLSVFHEDAPDRYTRVADITTQAGARTMALDQRTGRVYLSVAQFGPRPEAAPGKQPARAPMLPGTFGILVVGE